MPALVEALRIPFIWCQLVSLVKKSLGQPQAARCPWFLVRETPTLLHIDTPREILGRGFGARAVAAWAAFTVSGSVAHAAAAETAAVELEQVGRTQPPGCLSSEALERSIESVLGKPVFANHGTRRRLTWEVIPSRSGYQVIVNLFDTDGALLGTRQIELKQADCIELSEQLTLILAVVVGGPVNAAQSSPPAPPIEDKPSRDASPTQGTSRGTLKLGAGANFGRLPGASLQLMGAFQLSLTHRFSLVIAGYHVPEHERQGSGERFTQSVSFANLAGCFRPTSHRSWYVDTCLGAELGRVQASGRDLPQTRSQSGLWLAGVGAAVAGLRPTETTALELRVAVGAPLQRINVIVSEADGQTTELARAPRGFAAATVGVAVDLF